MNEQAWIKKLLVELFGSQLGAARQLQFAERTVRYWCQHGAPPHVERILKNLKAGKTSLRHARKLLREQRERRKNRANRDVPSAPAREIGSSN